MSRAIPTALSIAGSDSGANAGIQVDLMTFAAHGVYGTTAITCLTAQNPTGITAVHAAPTEIVVSQIEQVLAYYPVAAAKTGMLFNREIIAAVAETVAKRPELKLVVDPVSVATSGHPLLEPDALATLKKELLPLASVITPNLDEAKLLLDRDIETPQAMEQAARELAAAYQAHVLVKGGHLAGDQLIDIVAEPTGKIHRYTQTRIDNIDTHGSGCTLSSATAANLARGLPALLAIEEARFYLRRGMENALKLPEANFINHYPA
ncbi:bifunctional hydroxymethylpyrimidine kinase/phosphomethylpyrimidine kinase [Pelagicoccus sp. SDUM812003]|uniref:bifunctional hydroxymethylpyrimidine kinase/phosphomethylpyrimidine kinase n=1 Tax=Pelagicoccus sp. SDUM812003 TaxID=3041267 RepID=UPI00280C8CC2|nr:bifunctional hydroxymethylpyrimidine kinase/phosphomethylpyrimidine kinase [Pelagicoccus sp. SDUM812003]MDQ8202660.1 bifunctional hydroxymethylpyrimidine kinase/phosphomethylpyrimidine kinase [Pelagicoccus sp. SDUM812003]